VFGGAARVKDPIHSGTADGGMLSAVKDELSGGMASRSLFVSLSVPLSLCLSFTLALRVGVRGEVR
jgi:hypothetical protein